MSPRRKLLISVLFLAAFAILALIGYRRSATPPELARLLPEGDILVYANLKPIHLWDLTKSKPVQPEGEYQRFLNQTGIQFERDLDEAAMSRHETQDGKDTESAEILAGRFDQGRLKVFLEKISTGQEGYHSRTLYVIPHEGHIVRVCVLDAKRVAITNMASYEPMHQIIDGADKRPAGPSLLKNYYRRVPLASLAWGIFRTSTDSRRGQLSTDWSFDFLENTVTVGSVRYKGDLLLRADVITSSDDGAKRVVESAASFLSIYRSVAQSVGAHGTDPDVKTAMDSIQVQQNKNVAVVTATLSPNFLKKLMTETQSDVSSAPSATPTPQPPNKSDRRRTKTHQN